jgi:hypothetical protein
MDEGWEESSSPVTLQKPCHCASSGNTTPASTHRDAAAPGLMRHAPSRCVSAPTRPTRQESRHLHDAAHVFRHRPQPCSRRIGQRTGRGRGAPCERRADLHARRPGRHRSQGVVRPGACRAGAKRVHPSSLRAKSRSRTAASSSPTSCQSSRVAHWRRCASRSRLRASRSRARRGRRCCRPALNSWRPMTPCGWLGDYAATVKTCRCTSDAVARYNARLTGPLLDRIDLLVQVPAIKAAEMLMQPDGEPSAARCTACRRWRARLPTLRAANGSPSST